MNMESTKNVIEIIKKASNQFEYDEHYYFTGVDVADGKTNIQTTGDIWKALRFQNMSSTDAEAWCTFIKKFLGKHYKVWIKTISLSYEL